MARAPVSKTGGWGFESLHSCQVSLIAIVVFRVHEVSATNHLLPFCYHFPEHLCPKRSVVGPERVGKCPQTMCYFLRRPAGLFGCP